jgi:Glycosyltransferase WbsX
MTRTLKVLIVTHRQQSLSALCLATKYMMLRWKRVFMSWIRGCVMARQKRRPALLFTVSALVLFHVFWSDGFSREAISGDGPLILATYFPQFHAFEQNSRLWGTNFTEWNHLRAVNDHGLPFVRIKWPGELGMYNILDIETRRKQGELAREYGVSGFIYYHYWLDDGPVMDAALEKMLEDGEPTKRWDGGNRDVLLDQSYNVSSAQRHYKFLLKYFKNPRYLKGPEGQGRLMYVYRGSNFKRHGDYAALYSIVRAWQEFAAADGIGPLHFVQFLGSPGQDTVATWADGGAEFWPGFWSVLSKNKDYDAYLKFKPISRSYGAKCHQAGALAGWNTIPRQLSSGKAFWMTLGSAGHNVELSLYNALFRMRAYSRRGCVNAVMLNAWNEWGEGSVLEPDLVSGRESLGAVKRAISRDRRQRGLAVYSSKICFVVQTQAGHLEPSSLYNLDKFSASISALEHDNWLALIFNTDDREMVGFKQYVEGLSSRFSYVRLPGTLKHSSLSGESAYIATDWVVRRCPPDTEWIIATNADNTYSPESMSWASSKATEDMTYDIVRLPYFSRYIHGDAIADSDEKTFKALLCKHPVTRKHLYVNLGALALRYSRILAEDVYFSSLWPKVSVGLDGKLFEDLTSRGWKTFNYDGTGRLQHNANINSCIRNGGIWFSSPLFNEFDCYDKAFALLNPRTSLRTEGSFAGRKIVFNEERNCATYDGMRVSEFREVYSKSKPYFEEMNGVHTSLVAAQLADNLERCGYQFDADWYISRSCSGCENAPAALHHWKSKGFSAALPYRLTPSLTMGPRVREEVRAAAKFTKIGREHSLSVCFLYHAVAKNNLQLFPEACSGNEVLSIADTFSFCSVFKPSLSEENFVKFVVNVCQIHVDDDHYFYNYPDVRSRAVNPTAHYFGSGIKEGRVAKSVLGTMDECSKSVNQICKVMRRIPLQEWIWQKKACGQEIPVCGRSLDKRNMNLAMFSNLANVDNSPLILESLRKCQGSHLSLSHNS